MQARDKTTFSCGVRGGGEGRLGLGLKLCGGYISLGLPKHDCKVDIGMGSRSKALHEAVA